MDAGRDEDKELRFDKGDLRKEEGKFKVEGRGLRIEDSIMPYQ